MIVRTRKLSDKKVVSLLCDLFEVLDNCAVTGTYFGGVQFSAHDIPSIQDLASKPNERLIEYAAISRIDQQSDEIRFARGITDFSSATSNEDEYHFFKVRRLPDAYFDEVGHFRLRNHRNAAYETFTDNEVLECGRILNRLEPPLRQSTAVNEVDLTALLDQNLDDLQRASIDFLERAANARESDEAAFKARLEKLNDDFDERTSLLEAERAALEKRAQELNDREPMHERRRLRESLTTEIKNLLSDPPKKSFLSKNYTYTLFVLAGLALIAVSLALSGTLDQYFGVDELSADRVKPTEVFWIEAIKSLAAGAGGATFLWAGLSGMKKSEEQRLQDASELQRYSYDMDRARSC